MTGIEDPINYEITVRAETDHEWKFRRKDELGAILIPTEAKAEIRSDGSRLLWQALTCAISDDGWISVILARPFSNYEFWKDRKEGEWDLLVTYEGKVYRWVEGNVLVDLGVTR